MFCLQSKTKQKHQPSQPGARHKSEHWLVAETPSTEPKATSMLFLSLTARQTSDPATAFTFQSCTGGTFSCIANKAGKEALPWYTE